MMRRSFALMAAAAGAIIAGATPTAAPHSFVERTLPRPRKDKKLPKRRTDERTGKGYRIKGIRP